MSEKQDAWREIVVGELLTISTAPNASLEMAEETLLAIFEQAKNREDEQTATLVEHTWEHVKALANATEGAISLAAAAKKVAQELASQRDIAIDQYKKLETSFVNQDVSHPIVAEFWQEAYNDATEDLTASWDDASDFEMRVEWMEIDSDIVKAFWGLLEGQDDYGDLLLEEEIAELKEFIVTWTRNVMLRVDEPDPDLFKKWQSKGGA